ncbi:Wzz/FepE/Etk N-terminal domain-containing protein [Rhodothermus profundi]|uniref:G-rich domain on putative tyrosine kinase n=1 Tax=Rhodothermus profundi TaxID=633813 RepID=A0A1M6PKC0_9BACT|nr:Wzz/FepE/Etk N-terminal domain-containing protein [Rhodothermus profundi]SHK08409.1 G-rich domain on putative tyrosine kinase [Rhodothermus profundi]
MSTPDTPEHPTSGTPSVPPGGGPYYGQPEEDEISLLDLGVVIARQRRVIMLSVLIAMVVGVVVALLSPKTYVAEAKLAPSSSGAAGGALSALRSFGLNLGEDEVISPSVYPDIVQSPDFLLALARDTFYIAEEGRAMTLVEYYGRESWLARLNPLRWLRGGKGEPVQDLYSGELILPTEEEYAAIKELREVLSASEKVGGGLLKEGPGVITVRAETKDPYLSAAIVRRAIDHLQTAINRIKTEKARQDLEFLEQKFAQVEAELRQAEQELARFLDANRNPQTARLRAEMERLQRQVSFKEQLYRELQLQKTQAEIQVQKEAPVLSVVQPPVPPDEATGTSRKLIVLLFLFVGVFVGVGLAFVNHWLSQAPANEEERQKIEEVRALFRPSTWWREVRALVNGRKSNEERSSAILSQH